MWSEQSERGPAKALPGFELIRRTWSAKHNAYCARVLPGEYYVTRKPELATTVLGSCVSACISDPNAGVGGMNHFMLPSGRGGLDDEHCLDLSTRYGTNAMEHMINDILKFGGSRRNLEVKLFGGARVMAGLSDVGEGNIAFVREYLKAEGIKITSEDLGGDYPRKILYFPTTGKAFMKRLPLGREATVLEQERSYRQTLQKKPIAGEIELF